MGKRVSAKDMLSAGRARPPRESLAEQPVIPAAIQLMDQSPGHSDDQSTSEVDDQATGRSLHLVLSSLHDQGTSGLHNRSTQPLGDKTSSPVDLEATSGPDAQTTSSSEQTAEPTATKPLVAEVLPAEQAPDAVELEYQPTDSLVATSELAMPEQASSTPEAPAPSALVHHAPNSLVDNPTGELVDRTTSEVDHQSRSGTAEPSTKPLVALTTSELADPPPSELGAKLSVPAAATPVKHREPLPARAAAPAPATAPAAVGEPTGTYQRVTVFLTPAQRTWLKTTGRQLPVDGLSVSDIVRLAVTRLSEAVSEGLPLLEELTAQAYSDAQTMTGRRNRGLPPL